MRIAFLPRPTGSGHNMRAYAIADQLRKLDYDIEIDVYLGSLQSTFTPMFERIGVSVIDTFPEKEVDFTKKSNLTRKLDWQSMMEDYMLPNSFNASKIMKYVNYLQNRPADVIVSDFNYHALVAANICSIPSVMVTERNNFVIVNVDDETLKASGFEVNSAELQDTRKALNQLFAWGADNCEAIFTDRPYVEKLDYNTVAESLFRSKKMRFVGSMVREVHSEFDRKKELQAFDIREDAFVMLATVGGTSMFQENIINIRNCYIETFKKVRELIPNAHLLLIARDEIEVPEGVTCMCYVPDWLNLLRSVDILVAHPGWITVAECSYYQVPAIFTLSSGLEFHEHESYIRLKELGYAVHNNLDSEELAQKIIMMRNSENQEKLFEAYRTVSPAGNGAKIVAEEILSIAKVNRMAVKDVTVRVTQSI